MFCRMKLVSLNKGVYKRLYLMVALTHEIGYENYIWTVGFLLWVQCLNVGLINKR
jgi:hypothetical protein